MDRVKSNHICKCSHEEETVFLNADSCFADCVAKASHTMYSSLPKTGKPQNGQEWTLLASVIQATADIVEGHNHPQLKVVALGTGTKCLGQCKMTKFGDVVNDSHAEVIARRAFLRYLYHNVTLAQQDNKSSIFIFVAECEHFRLKPGISFHFYTSHTPCGDASIFPKQEEAMDHGSCVTEHKSSLPSEYGGGDQEISETSMVAGKGHKRSLDNYGDCDGKAEPEPLPLKKQKSDIHRTGAKCVPTEPKQDLKLPGSDYHVLGAVRTKPGRGNPTLSVSCSDKLMRWNSVGIQGALLSRLTGAPIYLKSITIGGGCPFSASALRRAVFERASLEKVRLPQSFIINKPQFFQSSVSFPDRKREDTLRPCSSSIVWSSIPERAVEVAVEGRRHGVTKKKLGTATGRLQISKMNLFHQFLVCWAHKTDQNRSRGIEGPPLDCLQNSKAYSECKSEALSYKSAWGKVLREAGLPWTEKPCELESFKYTG